MRFIYDKSAFQFDAPVGSWWEDSAGSPVETTDLAGEENATCEIAIIGGGYTGLSAAYHLARDHGADVRVLEAGQPGWGASGRNGGFVCPGWAKLGDGDLIKRHGLDEARSFHRAQRDGVDLVAQLLDEEGIEADRGAEGDIALAHRKSKVAELLEWKDFAMATYGEELTFLDRDALAEQGVAGPQFLAGMRLDYGFGLHPMKYVRGLARAAQAKGAVIHGQAPVTAWMRDGSDHVLVTPKGEIRAKTVIVATNGYTAEDLHGGLRGRLMPALSNILVTRPLSEAERAAQGITTTQLTYDTRKLLHYVRLLPDGRYLFGGRGGCDASPSGKAAMRTYMEKTFRKMYPAWSDVEFTHFWNGFICMTYDRVAHIGNLDGDPSAWCGLAYHGAGVTGGTWTGRMLARLVAGNASLDGDVPAMMRGTPPKFPLPFLRTTYLRGAYVGYGIKDELG